jgi:hypothetical protein
MIKKSIATALVMLGMYHLALPHLSHKFYQILGQQRGNYLRAQRYIYDVPRETKIIAGSSMAETLDDEALGPSYYKLTLAGGSLFSSLDIIHRCRKKPALVLIETNVPWRDADPELLHDLFSPPFYQLRSYSGMFREEGRPANFVGGIAEAFVRKTCQWTALALYGQKPPAVPGPNENVKPELRAKILKLEHEGWSAKPAPELLKKQTEQLGRYVDSLTKDGVTCVLFEMPIDSSLSNLNTARLWREAMVGRFPPDKYHWLNFDRNRNYQTRDGIHLVRAEAHRVTEVVIDYINRLTNQPVGSDSIRQASRRSQ